MQVKAKLHASLRRYLPPGAEGDWVTVELAPGATVADLLDRLGIPKDYAKMCVVEGEQTTMDRVLAPGSSVALFPPLAGG